VVKGTKGVVNLDAPVVNESGWAARIVRRGGHRVELSVLSPVNAPVGLWNLSVESW